MTIKARGRGLAVGAAIACVSTFGAAAQEHVFKLHHFLSAKAPAHTQMLEPWARQVEENADGRVKIEIYPSMSLGGKPPELIQQVRDGVADIVWTANGYTPGLFPRTEVFELPGVYLNDIAATNLAMRDMFDDHLAPEYAGVEVMWLHVHGGQGIMAADTAVREPKDLAGLTMRIPTRTGAWVIEALGATPLAMSVPEIPQALSKGVVDGTLLPWEIIPPLKLHNQVSYFVEGHDGTRFGNTVFQISMNKARWDGLPDDVKQAFRDASDRDWLVEVAEYWRRGEQVGISVAEAAGRTHIVLNAARTQVFLDRIEPVVERWIDEVTTKGVAGAELVETARERIAANGGGGS